MRCHACGAAPAAVAEEGEVRSNVRAHRDTWFAVWRCAACRSIHARDPVDLDAYYAGYPFLRGERSRVTSYLLGRLWRRIRRAGVEPDARVLDYGCGAGLLVDVLRRRGVDVRGYDAYAPAFADRAALAEGYDVVIAQDVIEHAEEPQAMLDELGRLVRPGGLLAIGTPDAEGITLHERDVHALHQPYHRHIFGRGALVAAGAARGWTLVRWYATSYVNTPVPTLNARYLLRYLRANDDTVDVAYDPPRARAAMFTPAALFDAVFGGLRPPRTDGLALFRR